jgi:hypothetical protein
LFWLGSLLAILIGAVTALVGYFGNSGDISKGIVIVAIGWFGKMCIEKIMEYEDKNS